MPDDIQTIAPAATQRDLATMPIEQALELYAPNFAAVLPPNIPVDHFRRMVVTAINVQPALMKADRRTLFNSCVKCASDGLLPDGREAALVIYKTKIKDGMGAERWIDAVQYLPMVAGIRKRLRNSGEVDSATAEVVYRKDRFKYALGDGSFIEHEPPPLDEDRGDAIGAYAIIKLTSGEVIREVMSLREIERVRAVSRSKDKGPWVDWWGEMARKTVLRRAAKAAPQASTLEKLLMRDDDEEELPDAASLPPAPARPTRQQFALPPQDYADPPAAEPAQTFAVIDLDGVEIQYATAAEAANEIALILAQAAKRGPEALEGALEQNEPIMRLGDAAASVIEAYNALSADLKQTSAREASERSQAGGLGGPEPVGERPNHPRAGAEPGRGGATLPEREPGNAAHAEGGRTAGSIPATGATDAAPDRPVPQALIDRGDAVAVSGKDKLNDWWSNLSAFQRGDLGAKGRGRGPHYERWETVATEADDAARQPPPAQQSAAASPNHPARAPVAAPAAPAGNLLAGDTERRVPRRVPEPELTAKPFDPAATLRGSLAIEPVMNNGRPDWRAWYVALFAPKLRQATGETLPFLLGDNQDHLTAARNAGYAAEIDAAVKEAWAKVGAP
jgi:recombination protein RecT